MRLTEHFTLEELTFSNYASRHGIDNSIETGGDLYGNIIRLANLLERIRIILAAPVYINSGYRCPELNRRIGGSATSAHMKALAADIRAPRFGSPLEVAKAIAEGDIEFDQLIYEGNWVHIGLIEVVPRRQILTAKFPGPKYLPGIVA